MIRIQLNCEWLDTYHDEEIELQWTAFRFQKELRAGFTNDLSIPKTERNLRILGAVGLLDSQTQLFGTKTVRGIVQIGLNMTDMMIQVAAVDDTDIKICLYEICFPDYFKGKTINQIFRDSQSTIWPWNKTTVSKYPNYFKAYNYGMPYNGEKAQYHPSMSLRNILSVVSSQGGYMVPLPPQSWMLMASKKTVCPFNRVQVIEFNDTSMDGNVFNLHGGQHITNDLSMDETTEITFNRNWVYCTIKLWVMWERKGGTSQNKTMYFNVNGNHNWWITLHSGSGAHGMEQITLSPSQNYQFMEGDRISFEFPDVGKYKYVSVIAKIEYSSGGYNNYITDDDFGTELEYVGRQPSLRAKGSSQDTFIAMDGASHTIPGSTVSFSTQDLSFAYFGYYCNLPEIKVCDLWHSLQWLTGQKLSFDHQKLVNYEDADMREVIEGRIKEMRPKTDKLAQKNYIKFKGDESGPVCTIPNEWLAESVTLHDSIFRNTYANGVDRSKLDQYSNPEYNEDWRWWSCDFDELEGVVLTDCDSYNVLKAIPIHTFGFTAFNQTVEVTIESHTPFLRDKDIIYLDGRRYMVISGKTSLETQESELVCLLFPRILSTPANSTSPVYTDDYPYYNDYPDYPYYPDDPDQPDYPDEPDYPDDHDYWDDHDDDY